MTTGDGSLKPGWIRVAFGDVVRLSRERAPDPEAAGFTRCVGLEHIDPGDLTIRRWGSVSDGTTFTNVFRSGQVLFGKRRAYLRKVAVPDFGGVCSGDIYVLESKDDRHLLPDLLPFICQTDAFFEHAVGTSAGSLSPRTNWRSLTSYSFALPPLAEQRRITLLLRAAKSTLYSYRSVFRTARSAMQAVIDRFNDEVGEKSIGTLGEIVGRIESGRSVAGLGRPAENGEPGVLKVSAVGDWQFLENENKKVPSHCFDDSLRVRTGDILVIRANADPRAVGRSCIVQSCQSNTLMLSDKTWRLVPKTNIDSLALLAWTKSNRFRRHILNQTGGTDAKNISKRRFLTAPFPCRAPEGSFAEFSAVVRRIAEAKDAAAMRHEKLERIMTGATARLSASQ